MKYTTKHSSNIKRALSKALSMTRRFWWAMSSWWEHEIDTFDALLRVRVEEARRLNARCQTES